MAVFIAIVYVGSAVVVEVLARTLDPIMEALALNFAEFRRRSVPSVGCLHIPRGWRILSDCWGCENRTRNCDC